MYISFGTALSQMATNPALIVILVLSLGTLLMNGAHDASNAIATAVATRSIRPGWALIMAAIFNFLGVFLMTMISSAVAKTMLSMVNFSGDNHAALVALAAAMVAIVVWGGVTWYLGIPSSQSHALVAGITGAAIALQNGFSGINGAEWMKVIYGLVVSMVLGFGLGWLITKFLGWLCARVDYRKSQPVFGRLQVLAAAGMAFMHGGQDGQKFMSICVLGVVLAMGGSQSDGLQFPIWVEIACAASMATGTAIGGKRIIKNVGMNMVKLEKWQGFAADTAAGICLLVTTLTGLPVSTTHTKSTAIMGVGTAKRASAVNWGVAKNMMWAWILTFPGCGLIGYAFAKLAIIFF